MAGQTTSRVLGDEADRLGSEDRRGRIEVSGEGYQEDLDIFPKESNKGVRVEQHSRRVCKMEKHGGDFFGQGTLRTKEKFQHGKTRTLLIRKRQGFKECFLARRPGTEHGVGHDVEHVIGVAGLTQHLQPGVIVDRLLVDGSGTGISQVPYSRIVSLLPGSGRSRNWRGVWAWCW